eukprot:TRINITY_DN60969_c0_g2_i1.p1 TRINITY_DN60969_c0_g2~~TRINITY_DN60969_c0_g2_i1.p1  ORF type:complete len:854 (+),score=136.28 TRINITY_DN60969_c0_g2_i1:190-2562(+)
MDEPVNTIATTLLNHLGSIHPEPEPTVGGAAVEAEQAAMQSTDNAPASGAASPAPPSSPTTPASTQSPSSSPPQRAAPQAPTPTPPPTTTTTTAPPATPTPDTATPAATPGQKKVVALRGAPELGVVLVGYPDGGVTIVDLAHGTTKDINIYDVNTAIMATKNAANGKDHPFHLTSLDILTTPKQVTWSIIATTADGSVHLLNPPPNTKTPIYDYSSMQATRRYCGEKHPALVDTTKVIACNPSQLRKLQEPPLNCTAHKILKEQQESMEPGTQCILLNSAMVLLHPAHVPSDFSINLLVDKNTILMGGVCNMQWKIELVGLMGALVVGFVLRVAKGNKKTGAPDAPHSLTVYHRHQRDGNFSHEVELLTGDLESYDDEDELSLSVFHDDILGMYIVSLGDQTLYNEPYPVNPPGADPSASFTHSPTRGGFAVVHITAKQEPYKTDTKVEPVGFPEIVKSIEISDSLGVSGKRIMALHPPAQPKGEHVSRPHLSTHQMYLSPTAVVSHNTGLKLLSLTTSGGLNESSSVTVHDNTSVTVTDMQLIEVNGLTGLVVLMLDNGNVSVRNIESGLKEVHRITNTNVNPTAFGVLGQSVGMSSQTAHVIVQMDSLGHHVAHNRFRIGGEDVIPEMILGCKLVAAGSTAWGGSYQGMPGATLGQQPIRKKGLFKKKSTTAPPPDDVKAVMSKPRHLPTVGELTEEEKRRELLGAQYNFSDDEEEEGEPKRERFKGGTTKSDIADTKELMAENTQKLRERGEKIGRIEKKTADLAVSAAGFGDMARQLNKKKGGFF